MVRCGFKNGYQKDMYLKEIGLHALPYCSCFSSNISRHVERIEIGPVTASSLG